MAWGAGTRADLSTADRQFVRALVARPSTAAGTGARAASAGPVETVIELLSGTQVRGKLVQRDDQNITFKATVGSRTVLRRYPVNRIHAITVGDRREVLNEMQGGGTAAGPGLDTAPTAGHGRTRAQVEALIEQVGRTPPDWWDATPLNCPRTLDLSWPQKPPGGWNAQRNVGQYLWDVIHPNPERWKSGIRLVHHLLELHKDQAEKRGRAMNTLGRMYQNLLQDYARAAFWWRQAGADRDYQSPRGINLALCYWKLGNKQMAVELLNRVPVYYSAIKLLADMGETQKALQYAESGARGGLPDLAYLYAGDACRVAGQYRQALQYYQKVVAVRATGKARNRIERNQQRARENIQGIKIYEMLDLQRVPDGTYQSSSIGYKGPLHVAVAVRSGRIEAVRVTRHEEKQFYSALTDVPQKIIAKQGVKGVDATSSATITSEAIINATAKALAGAMKR